MALFDIAHMGKSLVTKSSTARPKSNSESEANNDNNNDVSLLLDSSDVDTDHEGRRNSSAAEDPETDDDNRSSASARSFSSRGRRALGGAMKRFSSFRGTRARASSEDDGSGKTSVGRAPPTFVHVTMEQSHAMSKAAQDAGYGPAFMLLKTMNRTDREAILEMLLISRRGGVFSDESDCFDILFRPIFGVRARTNTTLRAARILRQSTWVHSLLKVGTALTLSARMVIASGDWRVPTRATSGISDARALRAANQDFLAGASATLDKVEHRFYKRLRKNVEARLGKETTKALRAAAARSAGPALAAEHFGDLLEPALAAGSSAPGAAEAPAMATDVAQLIRNMERAKPGFGRHALLLVETGALRAKAADESLFKYSDQKDMMRKMALVGAKDGIIGLSLGVPLAAFVNPFLGFPLMGMSFINLSMGSTEFNIIEPVCMIMLHQLFLAANGTSIREFF